MSSHNIELWQQALGFFVHQTRLVKIVNVLDFIEMLYPVVVIPDKKYREALEHLGCFQASELDQGVRLDLMLLWFSRIPELEDNINHITMRLALSAWHHRLERFRLWPTISLRFGAVAALQSGKTLTVRCDDRGILDSSATARSATMLNWIAHDELELTWNVLVQFIDHNAYILLSFSYQELMQKGSCGCFKFSAEPQMAYHMVDLWQEGNKIYGRVIPCYQIPLSNALQARWNLNDLQCGTVLQLPTLFNMVHLWKIVSPRNDSIHYLLAHLREILVAHLKTLNFNHKNEVTPQQDLEVEQQYLHGVGVLFLNKEVVVKTHTENSKLDHSQPRTKATLCEWQPQQPASFWYVLEIKGKRYPKEISSTAIKQDRILSFTAEWDLWH